MHRTRLGVGIERDLFFAAKISAECLCLYRSLLRLDHRWWPAFAEFGDQPLIFSSLSLKGFLFLMSLSKCVGLPNVFAWHMRYDISVLEDGCCSILSEGLDGVVGS